MLSNCHPLLSGIPQSIILTKVDKISDFGHDFTSVFKDPSTKHIVHNVSEMFGVPGINVMPVKNYCEEAEVETDVDILALLTLRRLQLLTMDHLEMNTPPEVAQMSDKA